MSTVEMINTLQVGQIAKCLETQEYSFGVKIIDGSFYWIDSLGNKSDIFSLSSDALEYRWIIEQNYVDFSKAIAAFMRGKSIFSYYDDGKLSAKYDPESDEDYLISTSEMINNLWSID